MHDKQIIFLHIPKTAGTTLRDIVYAQYGEASVAPIYPEEMYMSAQEFIGLPDAVKDRARVIMGHISFGFHRHLGPNRAFTYATFVRDPIRLCASLYNHLRNLQYSGRRVALGEVLASSIGVQFNNIQTRCISGNSAPTGKLLPSAFDAAVENIEKHFTFVGVTERFDESIVLATHDLGWKLIPYGRRNTANQWAFEYSADLSEDDHDLLLELNDQDRRLYEYVNTRVTERINKFFPDLGEQLANLQRIKEQPTPTEAVGNLGRLQKGRIVGWAKIKNSDVPAKLKIAINGEREFVVDANIRRTDLTSQTYAGRCGFSVGLPANCELKPGDVVTAKVINSNDMELNNSPSVFHGV